METLGLGFMKSKNFFLSFQDNAHTNFWALIIWKSFPFLNPYARPPPPCQSIIHLTAYFFSYRTGFKQICGTEKYNSNSLDVI